MLHGVHGERCLQLSVVVCFYDADSLITTRWRPLFNAKSKRWSMDLRFARDPSC